MKRAYIAAAVTILLGWSCAPTVVGVENEVNEQRSFDTAVTSLSISSGFDVTLDNQMPSGVVEIRTSENIMPYVEVYTKDGELNIRLKSGNSYSVETLEARLSPNDINSFVLSGGSELDSNEPIVTDGDIAIAISGGSEIELAGSCSGVALAMSGGSEAELDELVAESVSAAISGGSEATLNVTKGCHISASGGSEVYYKGAPILTEFNASGSSVIEKL